MVGKACTAVAPGRPDAKSEKNDTEVAVGRAVHVRARCTPTGYSTREFSHTPAQEHSQTHSQPPDTPFGLHLTQSVVRAAAHTHGAPMAWAPPGDSWASLGIKNQVIPGPRNQESRILRESESRIMSVTGLGRCN